MTTVIREVHVPTARPRRPLVASVRAPFRRRPWTFEVALFAAALLIYQASRALVMGDPSTAFENAAGIIDWEQNSGLFVEVTIQQWVLSHIQLTEALNWFYIYAHWSVTPLFFVWLYRRRRWVYPYVRNAFLAANGIALAIYMIFPVAPPRLVGGGFVDTLHHISEVDLHAGALSGWFNPHAAVPSMHFGYAVMIGAVGAVLLRHWLLRLVAVAYPAVVFLTITGTGNHYVLDAIAGGVVVGAGFAGTWAVMRHARRTPRGARPLGLAMDGARPPVA